MFIALQKYDKTARVVSLFSEYQEPNIDSFIPVAKIHYVQPKTSLPLNPISLVHLVELPRGTIVFQIGKHVI